MFLCSMFYGISTTPQTVCLSKPFIFSIDCHCPAHCRQHALMLGEGAVSSMTVLHEGEFDSLSRSFTSSVLVKPSLFTFIAVVPVH